MGRGRERRRTRRGAWVSIAVAFGLVALAGCASPDAPDSPEQAEPPLAGEPEPTLPPRETAPPDQEPPPPPEPTRFTLTEVRARILENANLRLAAEALRVSEAHAREREAGLWPNPYVLLRKRRVDEFDLIDSGFFEVEVGQPIELGGKRGARADLARAEAEAITEENRELVARTLRDAELAFLAALRLQLDLEQVREEVRLSEALEGLAAERVESGKESRIASLRFEAASVDARLTVQTLERRLDQACRELDDWLGARVGQTAGVEGDLESSGLSGLDVEKARQMLLAHPRLVAAERNAEAAAEAIDSVEADVWPDLTVALAYAHDYEGNQDFSGFFLRLPLPLWDRNQGRREESRAALQRARKNLDAETLALAVELEAAWIEHRRAEANVEGYATEILPRLEESLALTRAAYDAGRVSYFEVLDTNLAFVRARRKELDHLEQRAMAAARVRYLTGLSP